MRALSCVVFLIGCGSGPNGDAPDGGGRAGSNDPAPSHDLGACTVFPAANGSLDYSTWNADITGKPVDARSAQYIASMNTGNVHPDFGSDPSYGIPYDTVPGTQPGVPIAFDVPDESEPGPYPFPPDAPIEGGSDRHVLVIDRDHCMLYETGVSEYHASSNSWSAYSGAVFDLAKATLRPEGWTSADASGGSIFVGLVRYEEVSAGAIHHALRFTADTTQHAYVHPATHFASDNTDPDQPPMGLRVRLKAGMCASLLAGAGASHPQAKVVVQAMCTYGMILADNGSNFYVSGATDPRWDDDDLSYLKSIPIDAFEAVETGPLTTN